VVTQTTQAAWHPADAFPAPWGPSSFNNGAGMARLDTAAAFIGANMPRGTTGTLSAQDA